ncbi:AAA family ATPase [Streptomyces sp. ODS28]|uniref:ATP-binding protein n=1 Tax=Streptomyces sp. ODS28 TaxID=3136688 RepID=UPI0031E6EEE7
MGPSERSGSTEQDPTADSRTPGNLPASLNRFIGREAELARLCAALEAERLVTVTGVGGVGKSRLVLHAAERVQDRFFDGVWLVDLSALRDEGLLDYAVAEALGLSDSSGRSPRTVVQRHLRDKRALLVLDGCEHLAAECAELTDTLLRGAPGLRVLAAGRRPLELVGERLHTLAPMPADEAVALFTERAVAVLPDFTVSGAADRGAVAELCRRLDGIPLALELAAAQLRALSVEQIAHRLDDRFRLLTGQSRNAVPRHQTLRTAIGWSHELCSDPERLLWARLSVFSGDFDLEAAEYLCSGGPELPVEEVLPVLAQLVAQSVVVRDGREGPSGQARYHLLDTVREYGAQWLEELGESERLRRRHRDWYLGLATWCELDWFSPQQAEVAARLEQELPNLRQALEHSLVCPEEAHLGQYLAGTLWFFWIGCGRLTEGQLWLDRALAMEGEQPEARAKALWVSGLASVVRGDTVSALGTLHECLELAGEEGDETAAAYATQMLGCLAVVGDDMARGKALLGDALDRFRALGELNTLVILAQVELAMAHAFDGELDQALALGEEARDIAAESGERWALSYALYVLAYTCMGRGEPERARRLSVECLAIKRELHDVLGMAMALEHLAPLTAEHEPARAAEMLGAAVTGWRTVGTRRFGSRYFASASAGCRERVREALGEEAYERAYRRGVETGLTALVTREISECFADAAHRLGPEAPAGAQQRGRSTRGSAGRLPEQHADSGDPREPAAPPPAGGESGGGTG